MYNGQLQVNVNRDGRIMSVNNSFLSRIADSAGSVTPVLNALDAVMKVAKNLGIELTARARVIQNPTGEESTIWL
ncbi:MAG: hypothetical protein ABGY96_00120 [bacterium]